MAESGNPLRIVVFGGIGSGKSTFADMLGGFGATVIHADTIGHDILMPGGAAFDAVSDRWPTVVHEGHIDRAALAAIVFSDAAELAALEAITHPLIAREIGERTAAAGNSPVVVELPLVGAIVAGDWIWVLVDTPAEVRMERAIARGSTERDIASRMDAQPSDEELHGRADWVVPNSGSLDELAAAAAELWAGLVTG